MMCKLIGRYMEIRYLYPVTTRTVAMYDAFLDRISLSRKGKKSCCQPKPHHHARTPYSN